MSPFALTFLARLFGAVAVVALAAVTGHVLGRAARGAVETLVVLRLGLHAIASLGASQAATWLVARRPETLEAAGRAALALGLRAGLVAGALVALAASLRPAWFAPVPWGWMLAFAATAPLVVAVHLVSGVLLGAQRVGAWNLVALAHRATMLGLLGLLALPAWRSVGTVVFLLVAAEVAAFVVALACLPRPARRPVADPALLSSLRTYGSSAWRHGTLAFALLRADVLLLGAWAGNDALGLFAAASLAREALLFLPWIAGMLFFPRVAAATRAGPSPTPRPRGPTSHPAGLLVQTVVAGLLLAFPTTFVTLLHGRAFAAAAPLVQILVPAGLLAGYGNVALQELLGRGAPPLTWIAPGVALLVDLGGNLLWIPSHGAVGTAWAALAASAVLAVLAGAGARAARRAGTPLTP